MSHDNAAFSGHPGEDLDPAGLNCSQAEEGRARSDMNGKGCIALHSVAVGAEKLPTKEYEPFEHREVAHPTTNSETLLHLLKGSLGTGILAMPKAFSNAGYIVGSIGTFIIGLICTYCIHILVKAEYELCKRKKQACLNYPDTAQAAMEEGPRAFRKCAPIAGHIVNLFLFIYQIGTCCVYVVFVAENLKDVMEMYFSPIDKRLYMVFLLLPLILINWIRNLKLLAPFSTFANLLTFVGFGITLYYVFEGGNFSVSDKAPVGELKNIPLFFGTVLFALEAIGVIMPLENNMKSPRSFGGVIGVLNRAMFVIILLYMGMGLFGFLKYGDVVKGSITLNLPSDEILAQSVKVMLAVAIFVSHSLQCYVAIDITWHVYLGPRLEKHPYKVYIEYVVRTCLVLLTFLLAVAVPNLELFISLFGALCLSALGIAFPAMIQLSTFWYQNGGFRFYTLITKNVLLVAFGLLGLVVGTYTSLKDIAETFSSEHEGH